MRAGHRRRDALRDRLRDGLRDRLGARLTGWLGAVLAVAALTAAVPGPALAAASADTASADTASADTASASTSSLDAARQELDGSSAAMVAAVAALRGAQAALPAARTAAAAAQRRVADARKAYDAAVAAQGQAQASLMLASQDREAAASRADGERTLLNSIARRAYMRGPADISVLLSSETPADFTERLVTVQRLLDAQGRTLADASGALSRMQQREGTLEQRRTAVSTATSAAEAAFADVARQESASRDALARLNSVVAARAAALSAASAARAEDEARFSELAREAASSAARIGSAAGAATVSGGVPVVPGAGSGTAAVPGSLVHPVSGPITSPFGMRVHPITGVYKLHSGTDFGVACGTPVGAAANGTVLDAGFQKAYGNRIVLVSDGIAGGRIATTYNHLSRIDVVPGQQVSTGTILGLSGTTGYSTGCHLHFEVVSGGRYVDPMPWF